MRIGLCAHCCLFDDLAALMADETGDIASAMRPLFDALTSQAHARSASIWLTINRDAKQLLRSLATGEAALEHATFTSHPRPTKVAFLRQLCMEHGMLPKANLDIERFEAWVGQKVEPLSPADALLVRRYATWVHLARMRALHDAGTMKKGTFLSAKQSVTAAVELVAHLRSLGRTEAECKQADIDAWLSPGPTTKWHARAFVHWAVANGHLEQVHFPARTAKTEPIITQHARLAYVRTLLVGTEGLEEYVRVTALLFLLFGQPLTRVSRMTIDQVDVGTHDVHLRITKDRLAVPPPFDALVRDYVASRPNLTTSLHVDSRWLFPGRTPGAHVHQGTIMQRLRQVGIDLRGARNSALRALVLAMPAPIVADSLGFTYGVTDRHRMAAGATHAQYVAFRASTDPQSTG